MRRKAKKISHRALVVVDPYTKSGIAMRIAIGRGRFACHAYIVMPSQDDLRRFHRRLKLKGKFNPQETGFLYLSRTRQ